MNSNLNTGTNSRAGRQFPRNPFLIHRIQDALTAIKGQDMMSEAIRAGAVKDIAGTVKMIREQVKDGDTRRRMANIVGEETMKLIDQL